MSNFKTFVVNEILKSIKTNEEHQKFWEAHHCLYITSHVNGEGRMCNNTRYVEQCTFCKKYYCDDHSFRKAVFSTGPKDSICYMCVNSAFLCNTSNK